MLASSQIEPLLPEGQRKGDGAIDVTLDARYIEAGSERRKRATYRVAYRWVGGGLLSGPSIRFTSLRRG